MELFDGDTQIVFHKMGVGILSLNKHFYSIFLGKIFNNKYHLNSFNAEIFSI